MDVLAALAKIRETCASLEPRVEALHAQIEAHGPRAGNGISLYRAKAVTLLRYSQGIVDFVDARVAGGSVSGISEALVADWVALERMRPVEKGLRGVVEALLGRRGEGGHRPNPAGVVVEEDEVGVGADRDVYRPPRIAEVVYDGGDGRDERRARKDKERLKARAMRSEGVREMLAEVNGRPDTVFDGDIGGRKDPGVQRLMREDAERVRYEEENFTRLNVTKKDKKRRREIERALEAPEFDDRDEFADLVTVADRVAGSKKRGSFNFHGDDDSAAEAAHKVRGLDSITRKMERDAKSNPSHGKSASSAGRKRKKGRH